MQLTSRSTLPAQSETVCGTWLPSCQWQTACHVRHDASTMDGIMRPCETGSRLYFVCNQPLAPTQPPTLSGTEVAVAVVCVREGNRRSDVTPAMRHRQTLCGSSISGFSGLRKGDDLPARLHSSKESISFTFNFKVIYISAINQLQIISTTVLLSVVSKHPQPKVISETWSNGKERFINVLQ